MKTAKQNGKKAKASQPKPTFQDGLKSKAEAKKALETRDALAVERYSDELEAKRFVVLALDDFIYEVLARPAIKAMPKPGAQVVRTLITEKGMTPFTANRHWNEFRLVCMSTT